MSIVPTTTSTTSASLSFDNNYRYSKADDDTNNSAADYIDDDDDDNDDRSISERVDLMIHHQILNNNVDDDHHNENDDHIRVRQNVNDENDHQNNNNNMMMMMMMMNDTNPNNNNSNNGSWNYSRNNYHSSQASNKTTTTTTTTTTNPLLLLRLSVVSLLVNAICVIVIAVLIRIILIGGGENDRVQQSSSITTTTTVCSNGSSHGSSGSGYTTTTTNNNATTTTTTTASSSTTTIDYTMMEQRYVVTNVTNGVVASDQEICSQMAIHEILHHHNGTAIDAAIFIALCLGLVNPASSGLGGGAFLLLHHTPNTTNYYDDDHNDDTTTEEDDENDNDSTTTNTTTTRRRRPKYYDARTTKPTTTTTTTDTADSEDRNQKVQEVIDCRERAPIHANSTMYKNLPSNASVYGIMAIPIMGELQCLYLAHYRFGGRLSWETIIQPVIEMATNGIMIGSYLAKQIHDTAHHHYILQLHDPYHLYYNRYHEYDSLRALLTHDNDWSQPLQQGDLLINIELGRTLQLIAQYGIDAIYSNPMATTIANELQQFGSFNSIITSQDYINYRPTIHTPITSQQPIHGYTIMGVPPPSSGGAAIIGALRFLSNFTIPIATYQNTLSIHRIVEACKHVFSMRMSLSDPDYNTAIVHDVVQDMISTNYMDTLRQYYYNDTTTLTTISQYGGTKWSLLNESEITLNQNITDAKEGDRTTRRKQQRQQASSNHHRKQQQYHRHDRHPPRKVQRTFGYLNDHGTSHFSVVDQYGNAVAMTTSINTNFGSHIRSPSTGIIFSNTMDDFSKPDVPNHYGLKPSVSNYIQPMKRPLSSMSPTMVFRDATNPNNNNSIGDLVLVIGASGGPKIITAVLQVLIRYIFMGQNLFDAVLHPRIHNQLIYHNGAITAVEQAKIITSQFFHSTTTGTTTTHPNDDHPIMGWDINVEPRTREALLRRNHELIDIDFSGTVQAIGLDYETTERINIPVDTQQPKQIRPILIGVSDPRKDGSPEGY